MDFSTKRPQRAAPRRHDFEEVSRMLLGRAPEVCRRLLPGGHMAGNEWVAGDLSGAKGRSLSVNVRTGIWKDFAGDPGGGDLVSLWAAVEGCSQGEAKAAAERWLGIGDGGDGRDTAKGAAVSIQTSRATGSSPAAPAAGDARHAAISGADDPDWWKRARPVKKWDYLNADGLVFGTVYRFEAPGRAKVIRPWDGKRWQAPEGPRPLYRLPEVMVCDGMVVIVEGEKAADAVVEAGWCGTTCWGGAQAAGRTDWSPLRGRDVLLWPDNDEAGRAWLDKVGAACREAGVASVRVVR